MKGLFGAAAAAGAVLAGGAAYADDGPTFSGNVSITTDYKFRGVSQTEGAPAIQGGFDYANGIIYAGVWGSNVDFDEAELGTTGLDSSTEFDLYVGVKPTVGPVGLDLGVIGYFYPGADERLGDGDPTTNVGELDYFEGYIKGSISAGPLALGAAAYYSPEFTFETGKSLYLEASAAYPISDAFAVSAAIGRQSIDDVSGVFTSSTGAKEESDDYTTWNIGATYSISGFAFDLRYVDTSIEATDLIVKDFFTTEGRGEGSVILAVKRAL